MANSAGRDFVLKKNSTAIASARVTGATWNGTPIDTTNNDSSGVTEYLADEFATETLEMTIEGLTDDDVLSDIAWATSQSGKHLSDITLTRPNGDVISGTFIMTQYTETGNHDGATTFNATLVRSGVHTWTPAA